MYADIRCTLDNGEIILLGAYTSFGKEEYNKSFSYSCDAFINQLKCFDKILYKDMKKVTCLNCLSGNFRNINDNLVNSYIPKNRLTNKVIDDGNMKLVLIRLDRIMDIPTIMKITGLSKKKILQLKG